MMLRPAEQAWRFYTVPGNPADGFEHPELEVAVETWKGRSLVGNWWRWNRVGLHGL